MVKTLVIKGASDYTAVWVTKRDDGKVYVAIARLLIEFDGNISRGIQYPVFNCQLTIDRGASWVTVIVLYDLAAARDWLLSGNVKHIHAGREV